MHNDVLVRNQCWHMHSVAKQIAMALMMRFKNFVWLCLVSVEIFEISLSVSSLEIIVSPDGVNKSSCLSGSKPCSLLFALRYVQQVRKESTVSLQPGNYNLSESFNFTSLNRFHLVGNGTDPGDVEIQCTQDVFISFEKSKRIWLERFTLRGCGHRFHFDEVLCRQPPGSFLFFHAAVLIMNSDNLDLISAVIVDSLGMGLKLCHVGGIVTMNKALFCNNTIPPNMSDKLFDTGFQGGGVNLDFTAEHPMPSTTATVYLFDECKFINNRGGSGITMLLWDDTSNVDITVDTCQFVSNDAPFGGGVFLEYHDVTQLNKLFIANSDFHNNIAKYGGGASRTGIAVTSNESIWGNTIVKTNCRFMNNTAQYGGAVSHFNGFYFPVERNDRRNGIELLNCEFTENRASMGSAIGLAGESPLSYVLESYYREAFQPYHAKIQECNITDNKVTVFEENVIRVGAVYTFSVPITLRGHVRIQGNDATAVVIDSAYLRVFGDGVFCENTGLQGGALALYGDSKLIMMEKSSLYFSRNTAEEKGGAIFVQISGPPVVPFSTTELNTRTCFLGYNNNFDLENVDDWDTNITFDNNKAPLTAGLAFYATTLKGCRKDREPIVKNRAMEWRFVHYNDDNKKLCNISFQISTDPLRIVYDISEWHVAPSEKFNVTVQLRDEKDSLAYGIVRVKINGQTSLTTSSLFLVQNNSQIPHLRLKGHTKSNFSVQLRMASGLTVRSEKQWTTMKPCNPGFYQEDDKECLCMKKNINEGGISDCLNDGKTVYIREGYWAGMVGNQFACYPCPHHFCQTENQTYVASAFKYNKEKMCHGNRNASSVLCGSCKNGYSVSLGKETCVKHCSNNNLWLLVAFFIGTLIGILLILRIDVDIFTVYLNAWLYSYQVILFLQKEGQTFDSFISFIIGVANWRIKGVTTCLFDGMNNLNKLYINYILPVYVLLLLVVLAKIARYIRNCYINRNVFRAFSTLLVLCYTNITMISFHAVHYVSVGGRTVLFVDGDIDFHRDWKKHLPLTIIALLWIIFFVALLPLMLLFTSWFLHRFMFLQNFRAIFDTFQSCFKDEYRWFAGFYFICRIAVLVIAMVVPYSPLKRALLEMLCVVILVVCVYLKPYNDDYQRFNQLDAILLSNLCFFTIFSSAINSEATQPIQHALKPVVEIFAYVPLIYLVILLVVIVWNHCKDAKNVPNRREYESLHGDSSVTETDTASLTPPSVYNAPV